MVDGNGKNSTKEVFIQKRLIKTKNMLFLDASKIQIFNGFKTRLKSNEPVDDLNTIFKLYKMLIICQIS